LKRLNNVQLRTFRDAVVAELALVHQLLASKNQALLSARRTISCFDLALDISDPPRGRHSHTNGFPANELHADLHGSAALAHRLAHLSTLQSQACEGFATIAEQPLDHAAAGVTGAKLVPFSLGEVRQPPKAFARRRRWGGPALTSPTRFHEIARVLSLLLLQIEPSIAHVGQGVGRCS